MAVTALPGSIEWYQAQGIPINLPTPVPGYQPPAASPLGGTGGGITDLTNLTGTSAITGVALPSGQAIAPAAAAALATVASLGLRSILTWLLKTWGGRAILTGLAALVAKTEILSWVQDALGTGLATIIPGQQTWLGELPAGLGELGGRVVRTWTAGGKAVYFATIEVPTRRGTSLRHYVYSEKRSAWLPYSYRRNLVFGAKELALASALGHKRRMGKRRVLQTIAGHHSGARARYWRKRGGK